jgi:hypothetical protein
LEDALDRIRTRLREEEAARLPIRILEDDPNEQDGG